MVRHGETLWSRSGQHTGHTDIALTEAGRRDAVELAGRLRDQTFGLVLTSPLSRARATAAFAGFADAIVDDDLREWDYGDYEGMTTAAIRADRPDWVLWSDGAPGGETIEQVSARVDRVVERARLADGDVLAFGHGHLLRVLASRWLGQDAALGAHLALDPATLSRLGDDRSTPVICTWNA